MRAIRYEQQANWAVSGVAAMLPPLVARCAAAVNVKAPISGQHLTSGHGRRFANELSFGDDLALAPVVASAASERPLRAYPCGAFAPQRAGLFEVHGNLWEYVLPDPGAPPSKDYLSVFGGHFLLQASLLKSYARSMHLDQNMSAGDAASRENLKAIISRCGFRIACSLPTLSQEQ